MQEIRNLVIGLAALVLVFSAVDLVLPEGGTRGYARFVCGLVLMLMLLKPLSGLLSWEPEESQFQAMAAARQAEAALAVDGEWIGGQVRAVAEACGAQVEAAVYINGAGSIERIEMTVLQGDGELARQGVCAAFGLPGEKVLLLTGEE